MLNLFRRESSQNNEAIAQTLFKAFDMNYGNQYKVFVTVVNDVKDSNAIGWIGDDKWNYWSFKDSDAKSKSVYIATAPKSVKKVGINTISSTKGADGPNMRDVVSILYKNQPFAKGAFCVKNEDNKGNKYGLATKTNFDNQHYLGAAFTKQLVGVVKNRVTSQGGLWMY